MSAPLLLRIKNKVNDLNAHVRKDGLPYFLPTRFYNRLMWLRFGFYGLKNLKSMDLNGITNSINNDA